MSVMRTGDLVAAARAAGTAVLAFNVVTLEHAAAIVAGAGLAGRGVILQFSENVAHYHGGDVRPLLVAAAAILEASPTPGSLHLDHFEDPGLLQRSLMPAVSSVMFDASRLPYEQNVADTLALSSAVHPGVWVEAELGEIGGKDGTHAPNVRTDPDDAAAYALATGIDGLAVAVGSSHAMTSQTAQLDIDLIARIATNVAVPLVLHGSSGVPVAQLREAASAGIAKINVGTALNVAFTGRIRDVLDDSPALVDPRRYLAPARDAVRDAVAELLDGFGAVAHR